MKISKLKTDIISLIIINLTIGSVEFFFNIICTKFFGPEGMGLISIVNPVICLFMSFLTEGFVVTVSKMVGEEYYISHHQATLDIFYNSARLSIVLGVFFSVMLYFLANPIALFFLGDIRLSWPLKASATLLLLISLSNMYKGYFLGVNRIKLPGIINVTEKLCRYPILFILIYFCLNKGSYPPITLMYLCFSFGELISLSLLGLYFRYSTKKLSKEKIRFCYRKNIWSRLLNGAIPICATNITLDFSAFLTSIISKNRLLNCGYSYEISLGLLGKFKGMTLPIHLCEVHILLPL